MIPFDPDNPLAQVPEETLRANAALNDYAALGAGRSLEKLVQSWAGSGPTRHLATVKEWSSKYSWQERIARYHELLIARQREETERRWVARREEERERAWGFANKLIERAEQMLSFPLATVEKVSNTRREGTNIIVEERTIIQPVRWSQRDIAQFAETASKMARLAAGMETERAALDIDMDLLSLTAEDLEKLSPEELAELTAKVNGLVQSRRRG